MTLNTATLRKAAVLVRSLDADTAAAVLSRLSPEEAKRVRLAINSLGEIDPDERADVSAEFRRSGAVAQEDPRRGVELDLSSSASREAAAPPIGRAAARPFEFLEQARVESLVPYLAREHAQTVAVVLSYLAPARAAQVLAALPQKLQAAAIERLAVLGDTDPSSLEVLERELADWVARQQATRSRPTERVDVVAAILAAADPNTRREILGNLVQHNRHLAEQLTPPEPISTATPPATLNSAIRPPAAERESDAPQFQERQPRSEPRPVPRSEIPRLHLDDLVRFDNATLNTVLKTVDAEILVLALVGASDALVERVTAPMPAKVAKAFRQRLHNCGPTRLRDVEAAQQEVTTVAARILQARRASRTALSA